MIKAIINNIVYHSFQAKFNTKNIFVFLLLNLFILFSPNCKINIFSKYKSIDLTQLEWHIKKGFSKKDVLGFDVKKSNVVLVKKFPILVKDMFGVPKESGVKTFALQAKVYITQKKLMQMKSPAIFIRGIGEKWAVYLNGHLLEDRFSQEQNQIKRNWIVSFDKSILKEKNILVFAIKGYISKCRLNQSVQVGLNFKEGYFIQEEKILFYDTFELFKWILIGIYFFFGLYHIFLFIRYREILYTLFFGIFSIVLSGYFASLSNYLFLVVDNSNIQFLFIYILQPVALSMFLLFLFHYFFKKESLPLLMKISLLLNLISILSFILLPYKFYYGNFMIWYFFAIFQFIYILYFIGDMVYQKKEDSITIAVTILIVLLAVLWDILDTILFRTHIRLTGFIFYFFILLMAGILANRFVNIQKETKKLNKDLSTTNKELHNAQESIIQSEKKYRNLVEGFNDIIFILDKDLNFISCNQSIKKLLQYAPDEVLNKHFYSIFYEDILNSNTISSSFVKNKIKELFENKKTVQFYSNFKLQFFSEPKELTVTLQYLEEDNRVEIFGKISEIEINLLQQSFIAEKLSYKIQNYINHAELITRRITQNLEKLLDKKQVVEITLALKEIIINAIEHGNLNITYEEKTKAQMNDDFEKLLKKRQEDERYKNRKVYISSIVTSKRIAFQIQDEGDGFDHQQFLKTKKKKANEESLSHGRGIIITQSVFDSVKYNDKGNQVTLIKNLT